MNSATVDPGPGGRVRVLLSALLVVAACDGAAFPAEGLVGAAGARTAALSPPLVTRAGGKLQAGDASASDFFGSALAFDGKTLVVGASGGDGKATGSGAAYVFVLKGSGFVQEAKLVASDGAAGDLFGASTAVSGDTAIVGAPGDADKGAGTGAAYVFVRKGTAWSQQAKILAGFRHVAQDFGRSVALDGATAAVGAPGTVNTKLEPVGAAFVFSRSGTTWKQDAQLMVATGTVKRLGHSLALKKGTLIVGAYGSGTLFAGAAYVFGLSAGKWSQTQRLVGKDTTTLDQFGYAVALDGDTALIGANQAKAGSGAKVVPFAGVAYVFARSKGIFTQQAKLEAPDAASSDLFGRAVAVSGDLAIVAADQDDDKGDASGSVYLFARSGTTWSKGTKLVPKDGARQDFFGRAVAVSGEQIFVSAVGDDDKAKDAGSVYDYRLLRGAGARCALASQCASGFCVDGVCCDKACGGGAKDDCQACSAAAGAAKDGTCGPITSASVTVTCRKAAGPCDQAEVCGGVADTCPADGLKAKGDTCRKAAGPCDVAETCTGASATCPTDAIAKEGTVCREAAGACDVAETCDGAKATCPADVFRPDGTRCGAGTCRKGRCEGGGSDGGPAGDAGPDPLAPGKGGGCACDLPGARLDGGAALLLLAALVALRGRR